MLDVKLRMLLGEHDLLRPLQGFLRLFCKSAHHSFVTSISSLCLYYPISTFVDRKSTRLNSSHSQISYAVFCLKKKQTCFASSSSPPPKLELILRRRSSISLYLLTRPTGLIARRLHIAISSHITFNSTVLIHRLKSTSLSDSNN